AGGGLGLPALFWAESPGTQLAAGVVVAGFAAVLATLARVGDPIVAGAPASVFGPPALLAPAVSGPPLPLARYLFVALVPLGVFVLLVSLTRLVAGLAVPPHRPPPWFWLPAGAGLVIAAALLGTRSAAARWPSGGRGGR